MSTSNFLTSKKHTGLKQYSTEFEGVSLRLILKGYSSNWRYAHVHCVKSVQIRSFFWSVFSRIWTEYGDGDWDILWKIVGSRIKIWFWNMALKKLLQGLYDFERLFWPPALSCLDYRIVFNLGSDTLRLLLICLERERGSYFTWEDELPGEEFAWREWVYDKVMTFLCGTHFQYRFPETV